MAEKYKLEAEVRKTTGSADARRLRKSGYVPAVVYGKGEPSVHVRVLRSDIVHALATDLGENVIIDLVIHNSKNARKTVIIKEVQEDPVSGSIRHVDFDHISLTQRIKVKIPVVVKGEAIGVTQQEGVLERVLWELEIECLPTQIPENFTVDVGALEIGHAIHVKDLGIDPGLKILHEPDAVVVTVAAPEKEVVPEVAEAAEATEPEVIAKGKKEEEGAEGEPKAAPDKKPQKQKPDEKKQG